MERNALRLFTSCAWFFDDIAGVEPVQVLRYAARAIDLVRSVAGPGEADALEARLLERLADARSNDPEAGDGRRIYREEVLPGEPATARVAAAAIEGAELGGRVYEAAVDGATVTVRHKATGETERHRP